jgi:hypothetical protein
MRARVLGWCIVVAPFLIAAAGCGGDDPTGPDPVCSFAISPGTQSFNNQEAAEP